MTMRQTDDSFRRYRLRLYGFTNVTFPFPLTIDAFKVEALDNMAATIGVLESEVTKSREYLDRVAKSDERNRSGSLDLGGGQRL